MSPLEEKFTLPSALPPSSSSLPLSTLPSLSPSPPHSLSPSPPHSTLPPLHSPLPLFSGPPPFEHSFSMAVLDVYEGGSARLQRTKKYGRQLRLPGWSSISSTFPHLLPLLTLADVYHSNILKGLCLTVGSLAGGSSAVAANDAFFEFLEREDVTFMDFHVSHQNQANIVDTLNGNSLTLSVASKNHCRGEEPHASNREGCNTAVTSAIKLKKNSISSTLVKIMITALDYTKVKNREVGVCALHTVEQLLARNAIPTELGNSIFDCLEGAFQQWGDFKRLQVAIKMMLNLSFSWVFDTPLRRKALARALHFLNHKYPRLRQYVAECTYLALNGCTAADAMQIGISSAMLDETVEHLAATNWSSPIKSDKNGKDSSKLVDLLGLQAEFNLFQPVDEDQSI
ncbi:hypothetical protein IE077_000955 [Cardiosporidium cionae]|uniref:Tubulin-folding cofactor D C-terminal domain-containing protein n=1 Tax=Cardiosporidium cionae TaxID=476202 RepID=A0ABQ7J688_9APIC|nr:hypothetical protein IE077_000955 [Cardiosporidium cionae]|eukprot:KAF8819487.1 hypothetical protein IE077_000955 [Cardiosporidium cionae]